MKTCFTTIPLLLFSFLLSAQSTQIGNSPIYYLNGNVGVGTANPDARLEIIGSTLPAGSPVFVVNNTFLNNSQDPNDNRPFRIRRNADDKEALSLFVQDVSSQFVYTNDESYGLINFRIINTDTETGGGVNANDNIIMTLRGKQGGGFVGIGSTNPESHLEVRHNGTIGSRWNPSAAALKLTNANGTVSLIADGNEIYGSEYLILGSSTNHSIIFRNISDEGYTDLMTLTSNGTLGIGTSTTGSHKLAVEGSIGAREIKVQSSGWSDFVFETDYRLRPLVEVDQFIRKNKRLPDIPSAEEVKAEGVNLGEMDAKLLQKIEELTLYVIEQDKKNQELLKRIECLEAQLKQKN